MSVPFKLHSYFQTYVRISLLEIPPPCQSKHISVSDRKSSFFLNEINTASTGVPHMRSFARAMVWLTLIAA